jgi:hypothetical protein
VTTADEIDVKLLQDLHADGAVPDSRPAFFDQSQRNQSLGRSVEIISIQQDIGVEKAFSGHGLDRG